MATDHGLCSPTAGLQRQHACGGLAIVSEGLPARAQRTHQEACESADLLLCGSLIREVAHKVHCTAAAGQVVATSALAVAGVRFSPANTNTILYCAPLNVCIALHERVQLLISIAHL